MTWLARHIEYITPDGYNCNHWTGYPSFTLRWRHNGRDSVSNHLPHDCLLNRLLRRRSKKTPKLCITGLCAGNLPGTGNAENVSISWRHHVIKPLKLMEESITMQCGEFIGHRWIPRTKASDADVFFDLSLNKRLSKQSWGWWFETPLRPLWRHCNGQMNAVHMRSICVRF